ncbi:hypothetical protein, partial [Pallidibacillus pasinlerensis]|uniref:hypothetical protein n=1 Tax=Pallidibacillus pasinlerensis TaxID=2703818 RepID=UPI001AED2953
MKDILLTIFQIITMFKFRGVHKVTFPNTFNVMRRYVGGRFPRARPQPPQRTSAFAQVYRLVLVPQDSEYASLILHRRKNVEHFCESPPTSRQNFGILDLLDSP